MKIKPLPLYCVVNKKAPKLSFNNLVRCSDKVEVRLKKGEKIIKVKVSEDK